MQTAARITLYSFIGLMSCSQLACNLVPQQHLRQSQLRNRELYQEKMLTQMDRDEAHASLQSIASERHQLSVDNQELKRQLTVANQRLDNLNSERGQLQQKYVSLLNQAKNSPSPLSQEATRRFEELARKYPDFEFDPQTGVSKFHSDILFNSGSAELKTSATPMLQEFAKIMNEGDAKRLNILVVGHTDDKRIAKQATAQKHPTNWHLSTNRANSVVLTLAKYNINQERMGSAGYSMYQPVVPNKDDSARQRNRRVEIFVLAPDAVVAGWDPHFSRN